MILKEIGSRISITNLLTDFILNKIPQDEESIIQVVDCINFYIIKGKTSHNEVLDLPKVVGEFIKKFDVLLEGTKVSHTIDLIEYNCDINKPTEYIFSFFNSSNCSYHPDQIESLSKDKCSYDYNLRPIKVDNQNMINCSEFPHGYSLGQGRLHYYYFKHLTYNISPIYPFTTLTMKLTGNKIDEDESNFSIFNHKTNSEDKTLKSAILDVFDFDMSSMEKEIKKVDWSVELTNPLKDYDFLKKINKNFIII